MALERRHSNDGTRADAATPARLTRRSCLSLVGAATATAGAFAAATWTTTRGSSPGPLAYGERRYGHAAYGGR